MKEDLDVVDVLKKLRDLQVLIDNSRIDKSVRFKIDHSYNNVINLENIEQDNYGRENRMILVSDVDREETPTPRKRYDDMFKFGNSPFNCCAASNKIDSKMTGAFNFIGAKIGPQNSLEDYYRYKLTCKMFEFVRKM